MKTFIAAIALLVAGVLLGQDTAKETSGVAIIQVSCDDERFVHAVCFVVSGSDSSRKVTMTWKDTPNAPKGYRIERSRNAGDFETHAELPAHVTAFEVSGLTAGTYLFRVRPSR